jgi:hypothetical protein
MFNSKLKLLRGLNHLCRYWTIVQSAGAAHKRSVNGILGLLCREYFPGLVEYGGVTEPAYAVALDAEDRDGRVFNNKAERVKQELWVSAKYIAFISHS